VFPSLKNSGKLDALLSQVGVVTQLLLYPCNAGLLNSSYPYMLPCRVKSMCLLPTQTTSALLLI
jgi:hypothetical protein